MVNHFTFIESNKLNTCCEKVKKFKNLNLSIYFNALMTKLKKIANAQIITKYYKNKLKRLIENLNRKLENIIVVC